MHLDVGQVPTFARVFNYPSTNQLGLLAKQAFFGLNVIMPWFVRLSKFFTFSGADSDFSMTRISNLLNTHAIRSHGAILAAM